MKSYDYDVSAALVAAFLRVNIKTTYFNIHSDEGCHKCSRNVKILTFHYVKTVKNFYSFNLMYILVRDIIHRNFILPNFIYHNILCITGYSLSLKLP